MSTECVASLRRSSHACNESNVITIDGDMNRRTHVAGVHRAWQFGVWVSEMELRARSARKTFAASVTS